MAGRAIAALSGKFARIRSNVQLPSATAIEARPHTPQFPGNGSQVRKRLRAVALIGIAVAVGLSSSAAWSLVLRDRFVPKRFGTVVEGKVYRSGQISRFLIADVVERNHIGTIIDLNGLDLNDVDQRAELQVAEAKGVRHLRFPLKGDGTGQIERYAGAVQAIVESEHEGTPVLVHCAAGTQRTGGCVSFYRLLVRHDPPESVYRELKHYGWDPRQNRVLLDYVNGHMHELAQLLAERRVIDREPTPLPLLHP